MAGKAPKSRSSTLPPLGVGLLAAALLVATAVLPRVFERSHALVGKPVPALSLSTLAGTVSSFGPTQAGSAAAPGAALDLSALKGHVVVLDFWAPWCGPCRQAMPELQQLALRMAADGVVVLGVLVDPDRDGARAFLKRAGITYPQLDDERGEAAAAFSVHSLPTLVIVDKTGKIQSVRVGYAPSEELEDSIHRAM